MKVHQDEQVTDAEREFVINQRRLDRLEQKADAVVNQATGLGTAQDPHTSTKPAFGERLTYQELDELYEHDRFASKIVDTPCDNIYRAGFTIDLQPEGLTKEVNRKLDSLQVEKKFREAHQHARQLGGAAIVLVTDKSAGSLEQPLNEGEISEIQALNVVDADELDIQEINRDLASPNFNEPSLYKFDSSGTTSASQDVHASRVMPFYGRKLRWEERDRDYDGWGQSAIEANWETIRDLNTGAQALASTLHQFQYDVVKLAGLHQSLLSDDRGKQVMEDRIELMSRSKSLLNAVALDADHDEELETRHIDLAGLSGAYSILQQNLSLSSDIPLSILFGQMPSGLSAEDKTGRKNYFDKLRGIRKRVYQPKLHRLAILASIAVHGQRPDAVHISMGNLEEPTEGQASEALRARSQAWRLLREIGVLNAEQIRVLEPRIEELPEVEDPDDIEGVELPEPNAPA